VPRESTPDSEEHHRLRCSIRTRARPGCLNAICLRLCYGRSAPRGDRFNPEPSDRLALQNRIKTRLTCKKSEAVTVAHGAQSRHGGETLASLGAVLCRRFPPMQQLVDFIGHGLVPLAPGVWSRIIPIVSRGGLSLSHAWVNCRHRRIAFTRTILSEPAAVRPRASRWFD
jgi:hypothetical protein